SGGFGKILGIGGRRHHHSSPRFTSHGIGSRSRSNTFKNMIVGAAAGYLTYQAGRAIIRSMAGPMMWNNRPYYWGSNYYRPQRGQENVCRMPIDPSDPQFGNIYQPDGVTRPHEIVWGCGYYEYCCGYECCRGGGASTIGGYSASVGYAFAIIYIARAYLV
ncbi:CX module, partial [Ostertagia ostertagi]